jgi:hypothetical protein
MNNICLRSMTLRYPQRINMIAVMLILGTAFLVTAVAGGIDVTRMMTSPITFARLVGHRTVNALDKKHRDGPYRARDTISELAGGIAISYLINLSPFPWNMLIFLAYYKLVTALIFIIIPTVMALWIMVKLWYARKGIQDELSQVDDHERESLIEDESSSDQEDLLFRRRSSDTATVVQGSSRHPRVHRHVHPTFAQTRMDRPLVEHNQKHGGNYTYPSV